MHGAESKMRRMFFGGILQFCKAETKKDAIIEEFIPEFEDLKSGIEREYGEVLGKLP